MPAELNVRVPLINPSPSEDGVLSGHFQPRGKASFLTSMFRSLSTGSRAMMYYGPGSLPHRIIEALAMELAQLSFDVARLASRAVRESGYRAFEQDALFPARLPATFASGYVQLSVPIAPLTSDVRVLSGDLFACQDGLTARAAQDTVLAAGQTSVLVPVISEIPGPAGTISTGRITSYTQNSALRATNPAPISGGTNEETDDALHQRFQNYILGIQTASGKSLLSAAANSVADDVSVKQAVLIRMWRLPGLNQEMGRGLIVIDAGAGSAPPSLVAAAQQNADAVVAALQDAKVVSCSPYAVSMTAKVECRKDADLTAVELGLQTAWAAAFGGTLIEDGSAQGSVRVIDLQSALDAVAGVLTVDLGGIDLVAVPLAARAVPGVLSTQLRRGL